ncbi:MAG TPA: lysine exporter LysO family protein [Bacteroidales bacterium]|jgi:uncharacterized membrane protein YbjE (DUF340 family)|nr:lysine exporter LysO family protein [Bacteroidales bacterium]HQA93206.1 lysine exporter LysO family protein [Bacteroidales bacterium]
MRSSLIIVGFFILGSLLGYFGVVPTSFLEGDISFYALGALMFCVGVSLGSDPETLKSFKKINPRLLLLPLLTIVGTLVGAAIVGMLLPNRSVIDSMAVGSGLGYYSLSSIFITEFKGAELGTIALLSNISREILALLLAPVFVKYFGKLAPIAAGGATTMDTTLPIIMKFSGKEYMVLSVFHGFVTDLSVPFLVTLFCSI